MTDTLSDLLQGATVSSSGMEVTIACGDHDTKDAVFNALEAAQNWHQEAVDRERLRCVRLCEMWIASYKDTDIKYTSPRDYAVDAINDIIDLITDGQEVGQSKPADAHTQC